MQSPKELHRRGGVITISSEPAGQTVAVFDIDACTMEVSGIDHNARRRLCARIVHYAGRALQGRRRRKPF